MAQSGFAVVTMAISCIVAMDVVLLGFQEHSGTSAVDLRIHRTPV